MSQTIVTTLSPDELADLLAPRLAERLEAEWALLARRPARRPRRAKGPGEVRRGCPSQPDDSGEDRAAS
jgi:hypothetical protein